METLSTDTGPGSPLAKELAEAPWRKHQQDTSSESQASTSPTATRTTPRYAKGVAIWGGSKCHPSPPGCSAPEARTYCPPSRDVAADLWFLPGEAPGHAPPAPRLPPPRQLPVLVAAGALSARGPPPSFSVTAATTSSSASASAAAAAAAAPPPATAPPSSLTDGAPAPRGPSSLHTGYGYGAEGEFAAALMSFGPDSWHNCQTARAAIANRKQLPPLEAELVQESAEAPVISPAEAVRREELAQFGKDAGALLIRWRPDVFTKLLERATTLGRGDCVRLLQDIVRRSTLKVFETGSYETAPVGGALRGTVLQLKDVTAQAASAEWFGRSSLRVSVPPLEKGSIAPPVIFTTRSGLDTSVELLKLGFSRHPIVLVAEISGFDEHGDMTIDRTMGGLNPEGLMVRTDLVRFVKQARHDLRDAKASFEDHLRACKDPYIILCRDVTVFRGPKEEGYPFLEQPYHIHIFIVGMSEARPVPQTVPSPMGPTEWYQSESGHTALLERLNLTSLVAIQELCYRGENLTDSQQATQSGLPIFLLGTPGAALYPHPRDAVASSLKHWRRRFTGLFHTAFICTQGRALLGKDAQLASYMDNSVNQQLNLVLQTPKLAKKVASWHWEPAILALSVERERLEEVAEIIQRRLQRKRADLEQLAENKARKTIIASASPRSGGSHKSVIAGMAYEMSGDIRKERAGHLLDSDGEDSDMSESISLNDQECDLFDTLNQHPANQKLVLDTLKEQAVGHPIVEPTSTAMFPVASTKINFNEEKAHMKLMQSQKSSKGKAQPTAVRVEPGGRLPSLDHAPRSSEALYLSSLTDDDEEHEGEKSDQVAPLRTRSKSPLDTPRRRTIAEEAALIASPGGQLRRTSCDTGDLASFIRAAKEEKSRSSVSSAGTSLPGSNMVAIKQILDAQRNVRFLDRSADEYRGGPGEIVSLDREPEVPYSVRVDRSIFELNVRMKARKTLLTKPGSAKKGPLSRKAMEQEEQATAMLSRASVIPTEDLARRLSVSLEERRRTHMPPPSPPAGQK